MKAELNNKKEVLKQFITFSIESEEYGLEILKVQEIVRLPHLTKIPKAPEFIKGVIDLRGDVIPVIDLREKFGLISHSYSDTTRVIVVEVLEKKMGMVVDSVSQVIRVPENNITPPPPAIGGFVNQGIEGVIRLDERLIILLNADFILSTDEIVQISDIHAADKAA